MRERKLAIGQYRLCQNATTQNACNFAVPAADPNPLCAACRLTRVLPDLTSSPRCWSSARPTIARCCCCAVWGRES